MRGRIINRSVIGGFGVGYKFSDDQMGVVDIIKDVLCTKNLLEKFLETNIVVRMAPFSLRLALNFFKQSTVS